MDLQALSHASADIGAGLIEQMRCHEMPKDLSVCAVFATFYLSA